MSTPYRVEFQRLQAITCPILEPNSKDNTILKTCFFFTRDGWAFTVRHPEPLIEGEEVIVLYKKTHMPATVKKVSPEHDVAVLHLPDVHVDSFVPLSIKWESGDPVLAAGYQGGRSVRSLFPLEQQIEKYQPWWEIHFEDGYERRCMAVEPTNTRYTIQSGNSGGPVFHTHMQCIVGIVLGVGQEATQGYIDGQRVVVPPARLDYGYVMPFNELFLDWLPFRCLLTDPRVQTMEEAEQLSKALPLARQHAGQFEKMLSSRGHARSSVRETLDPIDIKEPRDDQRAEQEAIAQLGIKLPEPAPVATPILSSPGEAAAPVATAIAYQHVEECVREGKTHAANLQQPTSGKQSPQTHLHGQRNGQVSDRLENPRDNQKTEIGNGTILRWWPVCLLVIPIIAVLMIPRTISLFPNITVVVTKIWPPDPPSPPRVQTRSSETDSGISVAPPAIASRLSETQSDPSATRLASAPIRANVRFYLGQPNSELPEIDSCTVTANVWYEGVIEPVSTWIHWGDGPTWEPVKIPPSTSRALMHTYDTPGEKAVKFRIEGRNGPLAEKERQIRVAPDTARSSLCRVAPAKVEEKPTESGYIHSTFLRKIDGTAGSDLVTGDILAVRPFATSVVTVRSEPTFDSKTLRSLKEGSRVQVLSTMEEWVQIKAPVRE